jgi:hypothetical protein
MIGCDESILDRVKAVVSMTGKPDGLFVRVLSITLL